MGAAEAIRTTFGVESRREAVLLERQGRSIDLLFFQDQPCAGAVTIVTAGLSALPWNRLHEELLLSVWIRQLTTELQLIVEFVVRQLAEGRERVARGDVIGPAGPLTSQTKMSALYVCTPTYFDDSMFSFTNDDGHLVQLYWLIPIYQKEASLIERVGAEAFEDRLVSEDPDLLDLSRPDITAA